MRRRLVPPSPERVRALCSASKFAACGSETPSRPGTVLTKIPGAENVADVLTHSVASSAFVRAGAWHGLRLDLVVRPGSWRDRGPRGGVRSCTHVQFGPCTLHIVIAMPCHDSAMGLRSIGSSLTLHKRSARSLCLCLSLCRCMFLCTVCVRVYLFAHMHLYYSRAHSLVHRCSSKLLRNGAHVSACMCHTALSFLHQVVAAPRPILFEPSPNVGRTQPHTDPNSSRTRPTRGRRTQPTFGGPDP